MRTHSITLLQKNKNFYRLNKKSKLIKDLRYAFRNELQNEEEKKKENYRKAIEKSENRMKPKV